MEKELLPALAAQQSPPVAASVLHGVATTFVADTCAEETAQLASRVVHALATNAKNRGCMLDALCTSVFELVRDVAAKLDSLSADLVELLATRRRQRQRQRQRRSE